MGSACTMVRATVLEIARIAHHSNIDGLKVVILNKLDGITLSGVNTASQKIFRVRNIITRSTTELRRHTSGSKHMSGWVWLVWVARLK